MEIWTEKEVDLLLSAVLAYDHENPSLTSRKGVHSLEDFQKISKDPILREVQKTPEQMMDQWNQRSSIWLIGQKILKADEALLEILYEVANSPSELSEAFAAWKGGVLSGCCY